MTRGDELRIATVAHDLRTPLGAITLRARHLLDTLLPDDAEHRRAREEVDGIVKGARMMERLICDLLDASAIDSRGFRLEIGDHDTQDLVADVAAAMTEVERVLELFTNVIGNALEFTPRGGAIEILGRDDADRYTFSVTDNGPGIPPELVDTVFEPYVHGASRGAGAAGLGLGLYIARAIVDAHGGKLWSDRTGPTGTMMCFSLFR